ncbi:DNA-binding response regulator [Enterobacter pasteurii]|uniref:DNA-binding response regulator n=2 Tax=Enterobacter cloacae complex TaxID=354276 RepID=A0A7H8UAC1_ENTCL|nr:MULTISPECIES: DNA-binding response regulator [Enterobacter cloacae complex]MBE4854616.1 DNA-binding response regulator [Enterobacter pasteurii]MBE4862906.1 DNA-binding response regulator [Enterobacter cloacae complex sp. P40C2]MBE4876610.1 DNA-binding response regulator [Enterobacter cloacae complex sp. P40C]MDE4082618.1 DNA-binding response regulator [Enterobacter pasteurii]QKZ96725.1 DNA-binding response regulator [Enterobacter cloacae]
MNHQYFLYDKNIFYSQGIRILITSLLAETTEALYTVTDDYEQLITQLQRRVNDECCAWILCDVDSLPRERIHTLQIMKECYQHENKKMVILLGKHHMPIFFALYAIFPTAHWLLKSESMESITLYFKELLQHRCQGYCFSPSLVSYTRRKLFNRDVEPTISGNEWWLIEELFKGKSLSQISGEINVDVRRLSYIKRHLMKRLNIRNNIALFSAFRGMMP